jgi:hypothetical protein
MNKNLRKVIRKLIKEEVIVPPQIPNTMNFWHGGNLSEYNDVIAQKNGRYEYGSGLYLTTKFDVVQKYIKGGRKLYLVTVEKGLDINDAFLDFNDVKDFINTYVIKNLRKEIFSRIEKYNVDGKIKAFVFNNIILNSKAIKASNTKNLREFYINKGIDYEIINNAFGWGENMMVLYNMKKIVNIIQVSSKDEIKQLDL